MLQTLKTRFSYRLLSFLLIPAVILIALFSANHFTNQAHASGYGNCPSELTCIWSGYNYTGQEQKFGGACFPELEGQLVKFGFIGVGSYSGSEDSPVVDLYYYTNHGTPYGAFTILSGAAHHSPNTSANPKARYASAALFCR